MVVRMTQARPKLPFGKHGEVTEETIKKANLTREEKKRAYAIHEAHKAFLEILDCLSYPVDADGHIHDLNHMEPTRLAIAWTLALSGFRKSGPPHIKKRFFTTGGVYQDAHTWVDVRAPDTAAEELRPEHQSRDPKLPPDTRKLAAERDGEQAVNPYTEWHTEAKIIREYAPRPKDNE
jgi:hypothetical protein